MSHITHVDTTLLNTLSTNGYIPVISSIGHNKAGETLNMNADHVAERIAEAVKALKLIYLTDVQGLHINGQLQSTLTLDTLKEYLKHPDVQGGMKPKLTCSANALSQGVKNVHIINGSLDHAVLLELFTDTGIGTMIHHDT